MMSDARIASDVPSITVCPYAGTKPIDFAILKNCTIFFAISLAYLFYFRYLCFLLCNLSETSEVFPPRKYIPQTAKEKGRRVAATNAKKRSLALTRDLSYGIRCSQMPDVGADLIQRLNFSFTSPRVGMELCAPRLVTVIAAAEFA